MNAWHWITAVAALAAVLSYMAGYRRGVSDHRRIMQEAASEWRRCWLGDPVKASQAAPASHDPPAKSQR